MKTKNILKMSLLMSLALICIVMPASAGWLNLPAITSVQGSYGVNPALGTSPGPVTICDSNTATYINRSQANNTSLGGNYFYGFKLDKEYAVDSLSLDFYPGQAGFNHIKIYTLSKADYVSGDYAGTATPNYGHYIYPSTGWKLLADIDAGAGNQLPEHLVVTGLSNDVAWVTMTWADKDEGTIANLGEIGISGTPTHWLNLPTITSVQGSYGVNQALGTSPGPVTICDANTSTYINRSFANNTTLGGSYFYGFKLDKDYSLDRLKLDFYPGQAGFNHIKIYTLSQADYVSGGYGGSGTPNYGHYIYPSTGWKLLADIDAGAGNQLANHVVVNGLTNNATWVTMTWADVGEPTIANLGEIGFSGLAPVSPSTVVAYPTNVFADGVSPSTITVTLIDGLGNPATNKTVSLTKTSGPGSPVITPATAVTSGAGIATFTVASTTAGDDVFTVTNVTDSVAVAQMATVTFVPLTTTAGFIEQTLTKANNGSEIQNSGVQVRAYHFGQSGVAATVHGVTFLDGKAPDFGGITDTDMGSGWDLGYANFNPFNIPAGSDYYNLMTSMIVAPNQTGNGGMLTISNLTVGHSYRLQLLSNRPRNADVTVQGQLHSFVIGEGAMGMLTAEWVATTDTLNVEYARGFGLAEQSHFCGYALHDLTAVAGAVSASTSTVEASPTNVVADVAYSVSIIVTLKGTNGFGVSGKTVSLAKISGPGSLVITPASTTTLAGGIAIFKVASATAGDDVFRATDVTDSLVVTQTATVTFTPPVVVFTEIPMNLSNNGLEIQNSGVLVRAYHFGISGPDATVNGVTFTFGNAVAGDSAMGSGWGSGYDFNPLNVPSTPVGFYTLMNQLVTGTAAHPAGGMITISNLTVGHTYRLQVIEQWPRLSDVFVNGVPHRFLIGTETAGLLKAQWVSTNTTLNVEIAQGAAESPHFCGYALHDVTAVAPPSLSITKSGGNPVVIYTGILSTSSNLVNWMDFYVASPYTNTISPGSPQKTFYRSHN